MTKTRRTLAVATTLLALGGCLVGATSAMAADNTDSQAPHIHHVAAAASDPTLEVSAVRSDETSPAVGMPAPKYLELLKTPQDVDAAQVQLAEFMKARGLQVQLSKDEEGRPFAEYDTFVEANIDAVEAYWNGRLAQAHQG